MKITENIQKWMDREIRFTELTSAERTYILEILAVGCPAIAQILEEQKSTNQQSNEQEK